MSRSKVPVLICDSEDGCDQWDIDDYGMDVSRVNGVLITQEQRSLGWVSSTEGDYCPRHALHEVGLTPTNPEPMEAP